MTKYVKYEIVNAIQWLELGDILGDKKHIGRSSGIKCPICNKNATHGKIYTSLGEVIICPGDWLIVDKRGKSVMVKENDFAEDYKFHREDDNEG